MAKDTFAHGIIIAYLWLAVVWLEFQRFTDSTLEPTSSDLWLKILGLLAISYPTAVFLVSLYQSRDRCAYLKHVLNILVFVAVVNTAIILGIRQEYPDTYAQLLLAFWDIMICIGTV